MNRLMLAAALVALTTTGCAQNGMFARRGCNGPACHVARSQPAPRPKIIRTSYCNGGCAVGGCCGACDATCGCPEPCCGACDVSCGCPEPCCGCEDACCDPCCGNGACGGSGCCLGRMFSRGNRCSGCNDGCGKGGFCQGLVGNVASGCCPHSGGYPESYNFMPSPPVGQTAYPYYTVRGPRDFLQDNPPSIGPY